MIGVWRKSNYSVLVYRVQAQDRGWIRVQFADGRVAHWLQTPQVLAERTRTGNWCLTFLGATAHD